MEATGKGKDKENKTSLVDDILKYGNLAFDPNLADESRQQGLEAFTTLINGSRTLALLPALNLLAQPGRTQPWLRPQLMSKLALLPLRARGVQDTIEFILSVHPSSRRIDGGNEKRSGISHEALNAVSRLLSSPPNGIEPGKWFFGIAPQLFALLQGEGEVEMDRVAAFVIGFGILGRKKYGAPHAPGWKAFVEPMLQCIDPSLVPGISWKSPVDESIVTLGAPKILVESLDLARALRNLLALLTSHPHPSLAKRLLRPIVLPLWAIASWPRANESTESRYCKPSREMLKILVQLSSSSKGPSTINESSSFDVLFTILQNITFNGRSDERMMCWKYNTDSSGGLYVEDIKCDNELRNASDINITQIENATERFISFLGLFESTPDFSTEISSLFMSLCTKWMSSQGARKETSVLTRIKPEDDDTMERKIIEAKIMQKFMNAFPDKLVSNSTQVLDLVDQVLSDFAASRRGQQHVADDAIPIALSLLNIVLTSPSFRGSTDTSNLESIQVSLKSIHRMNYDGISTTAHNLLLLLRFRGTIEEPETDSVTSSTDQPVEDRKSYNLALSYLTTIDSPPPVRVQGLALLSNLVQANSPILDIPALLVLYSSLLLDEDEYIYLRAIQCIVQLSQRHPKSVMKDIIERYVDSNEDYQLDQRLRLGETLLQIIQNNPKAFNGETARSIVEGTLFIASRRGRRPKDEQQQQKALETKQREYAQADEAWDGEVPQLFDEDNEDEEMLAQIVSGWESKRGEEDVRVRASALSILGEVMEANISGMSSTLVSKAIDTSIHILTLELSPSRGILRRAAILLIMHFVKALDTARSEGKKLGFGFVGQSLADVKRILAYVEEADGDGLVRQHAKDVIGGLTDWEVNSLIPPEVLHPSEVGELRGLHVRPGNGIEEGGRMKPRIEEVE
ncbi:hypothetical protein BGZ60DRAFT_427106 [Tricladium varicosporioides]|nr:hypothetical protein BGZ60DRAFT_427106 [Hymenoscyphus varicosporioides]